MVGWDLAIPLLLWLVGFYLLWRIPLCMREQRAAGAWPRVAVIIPARNEEKRIGPLLVSLARQTVAPARVLVVDDDSSDGTAMLAQRLGATVVRGQPLPAGWLGKPWACWQGAQLADEELLLFLDADTWLEPDGLEKLLVTQAARGGALTAQPYHVTLRAYEELSAFFNLVVMAGLNAFTPHGPALKPAGAFGPCLLCPREAYLRAGGHAAVKGLVLEDIALGRRLLQHGVPLYCYGGRGTIAFRMYPGGPRELIEGWSKGFASGANVIRFPFMVLIVAWIAGAFSAASGPFKTLARLDGAALAWALLFYALYAAQIRWMLRRIGSFRWGTALLFPVPLVFFALVMLRSWVMVYLLRRVRWRGRTLVTGADEERL